MYKFTVSPYCQINNSDKKAIPHLELTAAQTF